MSLLAYGLIALAILGALGGLYGTIHHSGVKEGRAEVQKNWDATNELARKRSQAAAVALQADRTKTRTIIQKRTVYVDREITKLVDSGTCLKPAGVLCINAAIGGKECRSDPDGRMPAAKTAG